MLRETRAADHCWSNTSRKEACYFDAHMGILTCTHAHTHANTDNDCDQCPAGTCGDQGLDGCTTCPPNMRAPSAGSLTCTACDNIPKAAVATGPPGWPQVGNTDTCAWVCAPGFCSQGQEPVSVPVLVRMFVCCSCCCFCCYHSYHHHHQHHHHHYCGVSFSMRLVLCNFRMLCDKCLGHVPVRIYVCMYVCMHVCT